MVRPRSIVDLLVPDGWHDFVKLKEGRDLGDQLIDPPRPAVLKPGDKFESGAA